MATPTPEKELSAFFLEAGISHRKSALWAAELAQRGDVDSVQLLIARHKKGRLQAVLDSLSVKPNEDELEFMAEALNLVVELPG